MSTLKTFAAVSAAILATAVVTVGPGAQANAPWRPSGQVLTISEMSRDWATWGVTMSPDGKHVAALGAIEGNNPVIRVWSTDDMSKPPRQFGSRTMRFVSLRWLSNSRLFVQANQPVALGADSNWYGKAAIVNITDGQFMEVGNEEASNTRAEDRVQAFTIASRLPKEEDYVLVRAQRFSGSEMARLNIVTGRMDRTARAGDSESLGWVDSDGNVRTKTEIRSIGGELRQKSFYRDVGGPWRELPALEVNLGRPDARSNVRYNIEPVHISKDSRTIWLLIDKNTPFQVLARYDIATDTISEPVAQNTEYDIVSATFGSAADDEAVTVDPLRTFCWGGPSQECVYNDPVDQRIHARLERALPGRIITFGSRNNGAQVIVRATAPNVPDTWYVLLNERQLIQVGTALPGWGPQNLGPAEWVTYPARDGLEIPAALYLPPGYNRERDGRLPLVVMPHGGPWSRDDMDFDLSFWSQMFATRGFAVLLPQYRGSAGLGKQLWTAGDREWGAKMQDDKDDGARWLVAEGIADPQRMMMFGYSYGGFAAAAAAARSSGASADLYQCAISGGPAIDLERIQNDWGENRLQRAIQGNTVDGWDPFQHLDQVRIPWLVFHGSYDRQADTIHSRTAAARMRAVNPSANFRYVEIPRMAHQLVQMYPEHKKEMLALTLDWMDNNCGNISATFTETDPDVAREMRRINRERR
jgi:acetyl esterase/lipase